MNHSRAVTLRKSGKPERFSRGFVGPLGDDIPSIFPIVAGVMLFFGTIAFAGSLVAEKNAYLDVRKNGVSLSYIVTEKGFVNELTWDQKCAALTKAADASGMFVLVTIKRFCGPVLFTEQNDNPLSPYWVGGTRDGKGETWRECTNDEKARALFSDARGTFVPPQQYHAVVFNYPIAVPCPYSYSPTYGTGLLYLIVWKRS